MLVLKASTLARDAYASNPVHGKLVENRVTGARAVVGTHKSGDGCIAVVAFRGSDSLNDWKTNLDMKTNRYGDRGRVHSGYMRQWLSVRDEMISTLKNTTCSDVLMVGHSAGGAISAIAAMDHMLDGFGIHVATFGSPPAGDREFACESNKRIQSFIRVVNGSDVVPHLPMLFGFQHSGMLIKIGEEKGRCLAELLARPVLDHGTEQYEKRLNDCPVVIGP